MTKNSIFPLVSIAASAIAALLLAFAFTVPGIYLKKLTGGIRDQSEKARRAVIAGDIPAAARNVNAAMGRFSEGEDRLKLFFHHDDLEEIKRALNTCRDLALLEQSDGLICELDTVLQILEHMDAVETLTVYEMF